MDNTIRPGQFDVGYGVASVSVTNGKTIVATTGGNYHGCSIVAGGTVKATVYIYDSLSASTGKFIDMFIVASNTSHSIDRYIPIVAKVGLVVSITGVEAQGVIFFSPKG